MHYIHLLNFFLLEFSHISTEIDVYSITRQLPKYLHVYVHILYLNSCNTHLRRTKFEKIPCAHHFYSKKSWSVWVTFLALGCKIYQLKQIYRKLWKLQTPPSIYQTSTWMEINKKNRIALQYPNTFIWKCSEFVVVVVKLYLEHDYCNKRTAHISSIYRFGSNYICVNSFPFSLR